DAAAATHAVGLAAMVARRRRVGQRFGALAAVRLAHLVDCLALRTVYLTRHLALLQIRLDLASGEVALVDILRQVDLDQLEEPALLGRIREARLTKLGFDFARRVEALGGFARRQMVQRAGQGKQVAAWLRPADNLLRRSVPLGVDARLGGHALLLIAAEVASGAEVDHFD